MKIKHIILWHLVFTNFLIKLLTFVNSKGWTNAFLRGGGGGLGNFPIWTNSCTANNAGTMEKSSKYLLL